jgi:hypothetical protein
VCAFQTLKGIARPRGTTICVGPDSANLRGERFKLWELAQTLRGDT